MPKPRKELISLSETSYYHCISRCVRRAYLCGKDRHSGQSYEHRRGWVEKRLLLLAKAFAIDVCSYAVMSNHTHVVLRVNKDEALQWSNLEVMQRWLSMHKGTVLCRAYVDSEQRQLLSDAELISVESMIKIYRKRLFDVSWFMRLLNEFIAKKANREDNCTGRFWEGRFKSQAILDEAALIACMAYVDLNPIRAGIASSLNTSLYTSIYLRLNNSGRRKISANLVAFKSKVVKEDELPISFQEYLEFLTDLSSKSSNITPIGHAQVKCKVLNKLRINQWSDAISNIEARASTKLSLHQFINSYGGNEPA